MRRDEILAPAGDVPCLGRVSVRPGSCRGGLLRRPLQPHFTQTPRTRRPALHLQRQVRREPRRRHELQVRAQVRLRAV